MAAENPKLKIVIVGDGSIGKSCFLTRWKSDTFRDTYCPPSVFNQSEAEVTVDGRPVTTAVWYIAGQEDYDRLRPLSYPQTDIFLLAFSVVSPDSFANVKAKWLPEVRHYCPDTPVALLGLKHDRRGKGEEREKDEVEIPLKKALRFAKDIGAVGYYETSARTGAGVEEVVTFCVKTVLQAKSTLRRKRGLTQGHFSTNTKKPIVPPPPKLPPKDDAPPISIPSSTFAADWSKMVDNSSHSDVVFKLATKTYHAHRYVLASGSDVFRQLLGVGERVREEGLYEGWSEERLGKVSKDSVNSGLVEGLLHIEEKTTGEGQQVTELTFDPDVVSEVAVSRVLTFLYTGVVELNKDSEGLEETLKLSELLSLPELRTICQNACKGEESCPNVSTQRNVIVTKQLFLNKPLFSDVNFLVEGEVVHAHRLVLCTRCEVMAAMLSGSFQESQASEIEIPDVPLVPFLLFLEYLYTDSVSLDAGNSTSVLELANRYVMGRLMALCELYISKQVDKVTEGSKAKAGINVVDLLLVSQLHNAMQLSSWCLHFISSNYKVFENKPEEFSRLSGTNLDYVREHRWPPLSYETALEEYQSVYLEVDQQENVPGKVKSKGAGRSESFREKYKAGGFANLFKRGK